MRQPVTYCHTGNTGHVGVISTVGTITITMATTMVGATATVAITGTGINDHRIHAVATIANTGTITVGNTATIHKVVGTKRGD